ncbi:DUF2207 domain-containing protein [Fusobacterium necrophorum]|uniref:DUF2207 domain-containing protein n=1 Tax=Fusobacterium necrophorum TaxID=859 RepID=UPI0030CC9E3C
MGKNWQAPIEKVRITISLPISVPSDSIHAYGHGPLTGNIKLEANTVSYELDNYYPGDFIEAHILFGPQGLSQVPNSLRVPEDAKERLLAEEKAWAEEANAQREKFQKLEKQGYFAFAMEAFLLAVYFIFVRFVLRKAKKYHKNCRNISENSQQTTGPQLWEIYFKPKILSKYLQLSWIW